MKKIWNLVKPLIIPAFLVIGYFQEIIFDKDVSNAIFIACLLLYYLVHPNKVIDGVKALFEKKQ